MNLRRLSLSNQGMPKRKDSRNQPLGQTNDCQRTANNWSNPDKDIANTLIKTALVPGVIDIAKSVVSWIMRIRHMQQPKTDDLMAEKQCRQQMTQLMNDNANAAKNDLSIKAADDNGQGLVAATDHNG